jgi:hypothetical protein
MDCEGVITRSKLPDNLFRCGAASARRGDRRAVLSGEPQRNLVNPECRKLHP